jgi:hypothetical protein
MLSVKVFFRCIACSSLLQTVDLKWDIYMIHTSNLSLLVGIKQ